VVPNLTFMFVVQNIPFVVFSVDFTDDLICCARVDRQNLNLSS